MRRRRRPVWWPNPPKPPSEANYTIPGGATTVSSSAALISALQGTTAIDIRIANGSYTNTGPVTAGAGHRVWCESVAGVTLDFAVFWGARIGWEWHGGTIAITNAAKIAANTDSNPKNGCLVTDTSGSNNTAMNMRVSDCVLDLGHVGKYCIYLGRPAGARVQRCVLRNANYEGLYAYNNIASNLTNWLASTVTLDIIEDLDISGIYSTPRGNQDGTDEYALIVGHKVVNGCRRIRSRDIGWGGMATFGRCVDTIFEDLDMDVIYGTIPPTLPTMGAPTLSSSATGGSLSNGTYTYLVTVTTPQGQTLGTVQNITLSAGTATQKVTISWSAPSSVYTPWVTGYQVYGRSGVSTALRLLPTQPTGTATTVDDTGATIVSATAPPLINTTGSPTSSDDGYMTGQGPYLEVTTRRCTFQRFRFGPDIQRGFAMEWDENKNYRLTAQYTIGDATMSMQYGGTSDVIIPLAGNVYIGEGENPPVVAYTGKSIAGSVLTLTGCSGGSGGPYPIGTLISTWPGGRQAADDILIQQGLILCQTTRGISDSTARSRRAVSMDDGTGGVIARDLIIRGPKTLAGAPSGTNGSSFMDNTGVPHAGEGGTSELIVEHVDGQVGLESGAFFIEKPSG